MDSGNDAFDDLAAFFDPDLVAAYRADEPGLGLDPLATQLGLDFGPAPEPEAQFAAVPHYAAPLSGAPASVALYTPAPSEEPTAPCLVPQHDPYFVPHLDPPGPPRAIPIEIEQIEQSTQLLDSHECPTCHKQHASRAALKRHMRFHAGDRPFKCSVCSKTFAQRGDLKVHERSHTGETPFQCLQCGKQFAQFTGLKYHERVHSGERPVQCSQCGRAFVHTGDLNVHMRTHTGEKPFACFVCHKRFTQRGSVRVHMRRKHNQIVTKVPRTPDPALAAQPTPLP